MVKGLYMSLLKVATLFLLYEISEFQSNKQESAESNDYLASVTNNKNQVYLSTLDENPVDKKTYNAEEDAESILQNLQEKLIDEEKIDATALPDSSAESVQFPKVNFEISQIDETRPKPSINLLEFGHLTYDDNVPQKGNLATTPILPGFSKTKLEKLSPNSDVSSAAGMGDDSRRPTEVLQNLGQEIGVLHNDITESKSTSNQNPQLVDDRDRNIGKPIHSVDDNVDEKEKLPKNIKGEKHIEIKPLSEHTLLGEKNELQSKFPKENQNEVDDGYSEYDSNQYGDEEGDDYEAAANDVGDDEVVDDEAGDDDVGDEYDYQVGEEEMGDIEPNKNYDTFNDYAKYPLEDASEEIGYYNISLVKKSYDKLVVAWRDYKDIFPERAEEELEMYTIQLYKRNGSLPITFSLLREISTTKLQVSIRELKPELIYMVRVGIKYEEVPAIIYSHPLIQQTHVCSAPARPLLASLSSKMISINWRPPSILGTSVQIERYHVWELNSNKIYVTKGADSYYEFTDLQNHMSFVFRIAAYVRYESAEIPGQWKIEKQLTSWSKKSTEILIPLKWCFKHFDKPLIPVSDKDVYNGESLPGKYMLLLDKPVKVEITDDQIRSKCEESCISKMDCNVYTIFKTTRNETANGGMQMKHLLCYGAISFTLVKFARQRHLSGVKTPCHDLVFASRADILPSAIRRTIKSCPHGYYHYENYCYRVKTTEKRNWPNAKENCKSEGGDLISISSSNEEDFVWKLLNYSSNVAPLWIGLNNYQYRVPDEGRSREGWTWSDGVAYGMYRSWDKTEPNGNLMVSDSGGECVVLKINNENIRWFDTSCMSHQYGFVCKRPSDDVDTSHLHYVKCSEPPSEKSAWTIWDKHCMLNAERILNRFVTNQSQAHRYCEKLGSNLASIHGEEHASMLYTSSVPHRAYWIGLAMDGGRWKWTDRSQLVFSNWSSQSENLTNENCSVYYPLVNSWMTTRCDAPGYSFLCQSSLMCPTGWWGDMCSLECGHCEEASCDTATSKCLSITVNRQKPACSDHFFGLSCEAYCNTNETDVFSGPYKQYCYKYFKDARTWVDAKKICESGNGFLASVLSNTTKSFILEVMHRNRNSQLWIGLAHLSGGFFKWTNGLLMALSMFKDKNWKLEPPSFSGGMCVAMTRSAMWVKKECDVSLPFLCQYGEVSINDGCECADTGHCIRTSVGMICVDEVSKKSELNLQRLLDKGYIPFKDKFYKGFSKSGTTWKRGLEICKADGAHLLIPESKDEANYIQRMLKHDNAWFGGTLIHSAFTVPPLPKYQWENPNAKAYLGDLISLENIVYDMDDGKVCLEIQENPASILNTKCQKNNGIICEITSLEDKKENIGSWWHKARGRRKRYVTQPSTDECFKGWSYYNGHCYKFSKDKKSQMQSAQFCSSYGGYLVVIENKKENDFITSHIKPSHDYYIGLYDKTKRLGSNKDGWVWEGTDTAAKWTNWAHSQPQNHKEYCVIAYEKDSWLWHDVYCNRDFHYICEAGKRHDSPLRKQQQSEQCPEGWFYFESHCYFLFKWTVNQHWASSNCRRGYGGYLAAIETEEESNIIISNIHTRWPFWIGLHDKKFERKKSSDFWFWEGTKQKAEWTNFGPSQPDNWKNEDCVVVQPQNNFYWNDIECTKRFFYLCEKEACPTGWKAFQSSCYLYVKDPAKFFPAVREFCSSKHNSYPVALETAAENAFVYDSFYADHPHKTGWIGLTDIDSERGNKKYGWKWIGIDRVASWTNWVPGEPNNWGNEDCVQYWDHQWNDLSCNRKLPFVCEMKVVMSVPDPMAEYKKHGTKFYRSHGTSLGTYEEGKVLCALDGGHMIIPENKKELEYVLRITNNQNAWLGGILQPSTLPFAKPKVKLVKPDNNFPDTTLNIKTSGNGQCLEITGRRKLLIQNAKCGLQKRIFCQAEFEKQCEDGWSFLEVTRKCYKVVLSIYGDIAENAPGLCKKKEAQPVYIGNKLEYNFVVDLIKNATLYETENRLFALKTDLESLFDKAKSKLFQANLYDKDGFSTSSKDNRFGIRENGLVNLESTSHVDGVVCYKETQGCLPGWFEHDRKCIYIMPIESSGISSADALHKCQELGALLPYDLEQQDLELLFKLRFKDPLSITFLNGQASADGFKWSNSEPINIKNTHFGNVTGPNVALLNFLNKTELCGINPNAEFTDTVTFCGAEPVCDADDWWSPNIEGCYNLFDAKGKSWTEASNKCKTMNAVLGGIHSSIKSEIEKYIVDTVTQGIRRKYFVNAFSNGGSLRWGSGQKITSEIVSSSAVQRGADNFILLLQAGSEGVKLYPADKTERYRNVAVVCENKACQPQWKYFQGNCYRYTGYSRSKHHARADCSRKSSSLAALHSNIKNFIRGAYGISSGHINRFHSSSHSTKCNRGWWWSRQDCASLSRGYVCQMSSHCNGHGMIKSRDDKICFRIHPGKDQSWNDASNNCELANLHNSNDFWAIGNKVKEVASSSSHKAFVIVGGEKSSYNNSFVWSEGGESISKKSFIRFPRKVKDSDGIVMALEKNKINGLLVTAKNTKLSPSVAAFYVCYKNHTKCPQGYTYMDRSCLRFQAGKKTWQASFHMCQQSAHGGNMAMLETKTKQKWAFQKLLQWANEKYFELPHMVPTYAERKGKKFNWKKSGNEIVNDFTDAAAENGSALIIAYERNQYGFKTMDNVDTTFNLGFIACQAKKCLSDCYRAFRHAGTLAKASQYCTSSKINMKPANVSDRKSLEAVKSAITKIDLPLSKTHLYALAGKRKPLKILRWVEPDVGESNTVNIPGAMAPGQPDNKQDKESVLVITSEDGLMWDYEPNVFVHGTVCTMQHKKQSNVAAKSNGATCKASSSASNDTSCYNAIDGESLKPACPLGWKLLLGQCYASYMDLVQYFAAKEACAKVESSLLSLDNTMEKQMLFQYFDVKGLFWIGSSYTSRNKLRRAVFEKRELYSEIQEPSKNTLETGKTNGITEHNSTNLEQKCPEMNFDNKSLLHSDCNEEKAYICKKQASRNGWLSDKETIGAWLKIRFDKTYIIKKVRIMQGPFSEEQAKLLQLTFEEYSTKMTLNKTDGTSPYDTHALFWSELSGSDLASNGVIQSSSVKIAITSDYDARAINFAEVEVYGQEITVDHRRELASVSKLCPNGWVFNPASDMCMLVSVVEVHNFIDAEVFCNKHHGNLLSIQSSDVQFNVFSLLYSTYDSKGEELYWIGHFNNPIVEKWSCTDKSNCVILNDWWYKDSNGSREPDEADISGGTTDVDNVRCAAIRIVPSKQKLAWFDKNCVNNTLPFICHSESGCAKIESERCDEMATCIKELHKCGCKCQCIKGYFGDGLKCYRAKPCLGRGWYYHYNFSNTCYKAMHVPLGKGYTWAYSRYICRSLNADLAYVFNKDDLNFVKFLTLSETYEGSAYWVGLAGNRSSVNDQFQWFWNGKVSDVDVTTDLYASAGFTVPESALKTCSAITHNAGKLSQWKTHGCDKYFGFICQKYIKR